MITDLGGGLVQLAAPGLGPAVVAPFGPSWTGPFALAETPTRFVIGAGPGGGPRCQQRLRFAPGYPVVADEFLADPGSRAGVVFPTVPDDVLSFGSGYPVFLAFEHPYPGPWAGDVAQRVAELYAGCNVRVTTARPNTVLCAYGTAIVSPTVAGFPGNEGLRTAGGACTDRFGLPYTDAERNTQRTVMAVPFRGDVPGTAAVIAHEIGHGFGESDEPQDPAHAGRIMAFALPASTVPQDMRTRVLARTARYVWQP